MTDVQFRPATATDIPAIVAFGEKVIPQHYAPILGEKAARAQLDWWTSERFGAAIAAGRVQVATAEEELLGVVETGTVAGEQVVWKLYVTPSARGNGLGVKLIDLAISSLPDKTDRLLTEHFAGNTEAARFYEREGFTIISTDTNLANPNASVVWRCRELPAPTI